MKIPFSAYDFFGYLACGFLLVCGIEFAFNGEWLLFAKEKLSVPLLVFWIFVAYVAGHIIASFSSLLLEHVVVRHILRSPEELLFSSKKRCGRFLFPIFFQPFPAATQGRILQKSSNHGFPTADRALFFHCHAKVKGEKVTSERLSTFINIYGFCRNICLTCLLVVIVLGIGIAFDLTSGWSVKLSVGNWQIQDTRKLEWAAAALVASVGMFYRYLKFFRHYTIEVFTTYAEL